MIKTIYLDLETTGTDPKRHGVIQLACLVDIDGTIKAEKNWYIRPYADDEIDEDALIINDIDRARLKEFTPPNEVHCQFIELMSEFVDRYDKTDKFYPAGYNIRSFDMEFLRRFFEKNGDKYFGSWFNGRCIDPLPLLHWLDWQGKISLPNYRLETVCKYFGIELKAHDALSDIRATRELIIRLKEEFDFKEEVRR